MEKKIDKEEFIITCVNNKLSTEPVAKKELATNMGISEQHFFRLQSKHEDEINELYEKKRRLPAIKEAYTRKLLRLLERIDNADLGDIRLAAELSGDLKAGGQPSEGGVMNQFLILSKEDLDGGKIDQLHEEELRRTRARNKSKQT